LVYTNLGITEPHHPLTHHRGIPERMEQARKIDIYHGSLFKYFLERMRATPDGDGSLLDHVMLVYGGGISDGQEHLVQNLPVLLVGGGAGQLKGGRHLRYAKDTPMANLYLTLLDKLGIAVENFGDSTGKVNLLSVA
ncbi:MAG: DUF1552 domain-containing protein, partial [Terriglobia bacterium]